MRDVTPGSLEVDVGEVFTEAVQVTRLAGSGKLREQPDVGVEVGGHGVDRLPAEDESGSVQLGKDRRDIRGGLPVAFHPVEVHQLLDVALHTACARYVLGPCGEEEELLERAVHAVDEVLHLACRGDACHPLPQMTMGSSILPDERSFDILLPRLRRPGRTVAVAMVRTCMVS